MKMAGSDPGHFFVFGPPAVEGRYQTLFEAVNMKLLQ
jgi:hypothetical protein